MSSQELVRDSQASRREDVVDRLRDPDAAVVEMQIRELEERNAARPVVDAEARSSTVVYEGDRQEVVKRELEREPRCRPVPNLGDRGVIRYISSRTQLLGEAACQLLHRIDGLPCVHAPSSLRHGPHGGSNHGEDASRLRGG